MHSLSTPTQKYAQCPLNNAFCSIKLLVRAECMRCPYALQKDCQANIVATIKVIISLLSFFLLRPLLFSLKGLT